MHSPRPHVLNVRLASTEFLALASIAETIARQKHNPFPDRSSACVSACNKDPVLGVIGIQKGPL